MKVQVIGRQIVIPPPEGMVDAQRVLGMPGLRAAGGQIVGSFQPPERIARIARGDNPDDLYVVAVIPPGNAPQDALNTTDFFDYRSRSLATERGPRAPARHAMREALDRCIEGNCLPVESPFRGPSPDTLFLGFRSHDDRVIQRVKIVWWPDKGVCRLQADALVLVRNRVMDLRWARDEPFSITGLTDVVESLQRWCDAVIEAND